MQAVLNWITGLGNNLFSKKKTKKVTTTSVVHTNLHHTVHQARTAHSGYSTCLPYTACTSWRSGPRSWAGNTLGGRGPATKCQPHSSDLEGTGLLYKTSKNLSVLFSKYQHTKCEQKQEENTNCIPKGDDLLIQQVHVSNFHHIFVLWYGWVW